MQREDKQAKPRLQRQPASEPAHAPAAGATLADRRPQSVAQRQLIEAIARRPHPPFGGPTVQRADAEECEPQQARSGAPVQRQESAAAAPNRTGLPDGLKAGVESLSGLSMDHVRVHYGSSKPAQLNALAYAQGSEIHLAQGQERHLPHEAWHVVQQAQGRVRPTMQMMEGVPVNDDAKLEEEADVMGAKALAPAAQRKDRTVAHQHPGAEPPVQRLRTSGALTPPSKRSNSFRAVHTALDSFHAYVDSQQVGQNAGTIMAQWTTVANYLGALHSACVAYLQSKPDGEDRAEVRSLMSEAMRERVIGASLAIRLARNPPANLSTWGAALAAAVANGPVAMNHPVDFGAAAPVVTVGGGVNTLSVFNEGVGTTYFKADKAHIEDPDAHPQGSAERTRATNERYKTETVGIDAANPRLSARDVASSRLDQLLGGDVTARAEFALRTVGGNGVSGSIMSKAVGEQAGAIANQGRFDAGAVAGTANSYGREDPQLQRLLSRLQLLDAISFQLDRHLGNLYVHKDSQQRVVAVTGIDNDMSWGTKSNLTASGKHEFMGLSRFVDEELALRILHLADDDLRWVLTGLLNDAEINAAVVRLNILKQHLSGLKLLKPNEWDAATAAGMFDEGRTYYSKLR